MALFGGSKPKVAPAEPEGSEGAAQDVLDAITDGDATALDLALKRHYEFCSDPAEPDADDVDDEG